MSSSKIRTPLDPVKNEEIASQLAQFSQLEELSNIRESLEAGTSIDALLTPGALEMSNVDLSQEFANMITAQRGYQANARIITTADDILEETVRLKS